MSARAIAIHGNEMSRERRANLEIKSECPALVGGHNIYAPGFLAFGKSEEYDPVLNIY